MTARSPMALKSLTLLLLMGALSACGSNDHYQAAPPAGRPDRDAPKAGDTVLAPGGVGAAIVSGPTKEGETAVAVNAFLWRASLDTIAFMPLASADPFGGVIISDWYGPPETPDERFK